MFEISTRGNPVLRIFLCNSVEILQIPLLYWVCRFEFSILDIRFGSGDYENCRVKVFARNSVAIFHFGRFTDFPADCVLVQHRSFSIFRDKKYSFLYNFNANYCNCNDKLKLCINFLNSKIFTKIKDVISKCNFPTPRLNALSQSTTYI